MFNFFTKKTEGIEDLAKDLEKLLNKYESFTSMSQPSLTMAGRDLLNKQKLSILEAMLVLQASSKNPKIMFIDYSGRTSASVSSVTTTLNLPPTIKVSTPSPALVPNESLFTGLLTTPIIVNVDPEDEFVKQLNNK